MWDTKTRYCEHHWPKKEASKIRKEDAFNAAMIRQLFQWAISNDISGNQNLKMKWRRRIFKSIKRGLLQVLAHYVNRYVENCTIFYALFSSIWWRGKFYSKSKFVLYHFPRNLKSWVKSSWPWLYFQLYLLWSRPICSLIKLMKVD